MEIGDFIVITLIIIGLLVGSGYLQTHNPGAYSVVDNVWTKVSTGAYDLVSGFITQIKTNPKTNTTGGG
jgi:hypothetical protein